MQSLRLANFPLVALLCLVSADSVAADQPRASRFGTSATEGYKEDYQRAPMPVGFQVIVSEIDGPVFADSSGKTLYQWPLRPLRNGFIGEAKGKPTCDSHVYTENSGTMSPYPAGYTLPEVEKRHSCVEEWPPVYASVDAKTVGKWTIVSRPDGKKQWAYDGYALYTSILDRKAGDTFGGRKPVGAYADGPSVRVPVGPPSNVPPQFSVQAVAAGRLLAVKRGFSVYAWDGDGPNKSNCTAACLRDWQPVLAPERTNAKGDWGVIERSPGVNQWTFRQKPLYTHISDPAVRSFVGSDIPGWRNVFVQPPVKPPRGFTTQDTAGGQVLADPNGKTIYLYNCGDDAVDQLSCDHPDNTQAYRFAVCGGGDPERCVRTFPYVIAPEGAASGNKSWGTMHIDPMTGHRARPQQRGALRVWTYRDRPIYTFSGDRQPGDANGDAWGEYDGQRNGFTAFWLRDDSDGKAG